MAWMPGPPRGTPQPPERPPTTSRARDRKGEIPECSESKPVRAGENSPRREPWGTCEILEAPARGERSRPCHLPPPPGAFLLMPRSHGLRRGLLSFALRAEWSARCAQATATSLGNPTSRPRRAFVIVDGLPLVVVFRADHTPSFRNGLRRLVGLEAAEERLLARRALGVLQAAVAQHPRVVHLDVLGIDARHLLERRQRSHVLPFQEEDAGDLVQRHAVARVLRAHRLKRFQRSVVVAVGALNLGFE